MNDLKTSVSVSGREYQLFRDKANKLWLGHSFATEADPVLLFGPIDPRNLYNSPARNRSNDPYIDAAQEAYGRFIKTQTNL